MENFKSVPPADHTAKNQRQKATAKGFYGELKEENEIIEVALSIGFKGSRSGVYFQGECPAHGSEKGKCLSIKKRTQYWKCFHCGAGGDVINLVELFKKCDHKTAVKFLADRVGMAYWGGKTLTPAEIAQHEADIKEKILVEAMLTRAAEWYYDQLQYHPEIKVHLLNHYGFSEEVIEEFKIGFAPVGGRHSSLAAHLNQFPEFVGKLGLSGLFSFSKPEGPYFDFFKGRIIFPYWKAGAVVYMAARATVLTPVDVYECYSTKDGASKQDDDGKPTHIKYKKLRTHDPLDEKKKHISRFIQNDAFMGEDTVRRADEIVIAEGAPDWVSAVDKGLAAISPATVSFPEKDWEKLADLTSEAKCIYIINDNEDNQAGFKGAMKTGIFLTRKGRNVYLVKLPRPEGLSKIDLNEYFKDHTADDLRELMKSAKTVIQIMIDALDKDFLKARPVLETEIAPIIIELDDITKKVYISLIVNKVKVKESLISEILHKVEVEKIQREAQLKEAEKNKVDPEIEKAAAELARDPLVLRKRIDIINMSGVVGERQNIAMYYAALDSRLLPEGQAGQNNALAVKVSGHFGAGKSYTVMQCLVLYPAHAYRLITNGSSKSIYHLQPDALKYKCLIIAEAFQLQANNAKDSELVYAIRSLISEGRVTYSCVEKEEDGTLATVDKIIEGPTSFITTTIMEELEPQLEDRLISIHPNESILQTKKIIEMTANIKAGKIKSLPDKTIQLWKAYHASLEPINVVIPFATKISDFVNDNEQIPIQTRRAFNRVLILIQAVTVAYQYQREKDSAGRVIAEMADYCMALQIVKEAFQESMGQKEIKTQARLDFVKEKGMVTHKELVKEFCISPSGVTGWISSRVKEGSLFWCDKKGAYFADNEDLKRAKSSGEAYVMVSTHYDSSDISGLPSPYDLTGDDEWDEKKGGELYVKYDLQLDKKDIPAVCSSVHQAFTPLVNTPDDNNDDEIIDELDSDEGGVRVFGQNPENDDDNRWESDGDSEDDAGSWEYIDLK